MGASNSHRLSKTDMEYFQSRVSFTEPEIQEWYQEFKRHCKRDKSGDFLTVQDFQAVYRKMFPGDTSDYVRHIFRTFDTDGNGKVHFREFLIGLSISGTDDFEKGLRWAFDVYDVEKNGVISKPEMAEIVKSVYKMLDPGLVRNPEEYDTPEMVVEKMFLKMDKDRDTLLTWEEFRDGVISDPFLFNLLQCNPPYHDDSEGDVF